jgi:crotonobetainyl-CoA:carnitine CoA-transferase CaiB-like acyl-CoA transferase
MDRADLENDERFATQVARIHNYMELDAIVSAWTSRFSRDETLTKLEAQGIAAAPVRTPDEANRDPRVLARHEVVELAHPVHGRTADVFGPGVPIVFSATPARMEAASSPLAAHNAEIYGELIGLDEATLARLREEHAI